MQYKDFIIEKEYTSNIHRLSQSGEDRKEAGYICRFYHPEDNLREHCFASVPLVSGEDYDWKDDDGEITAIINYVDNHYEELISKANRLNGERAYSILQSLTNWMITSFKANDLKEIIESEIDFSKEEFNQIAGYDYFE